MIPTTPKANETASGMLQDHRLIPILRQNTLATERYSDSESSPSSSMSDIFEITTREDGPLFVYSGGSVEANSSTLASVAEETISLNPLIQISPSAHHNHIASALGFTCHGRRFQFSKANPSSKGNWSKRKRTMRDLAKLINETGSPPEPNVNNANVKSLPEAQSLQTTRYIQVPGFRNDFYSNLVCWSTITNDIVFGIAGFAYSWDSSSHNIREIILHDYDVITCISCSSKDPMVIGTATGRLILLSQLDHYHIATEHGTDGGSIHALTWFKDNMRFLASDNSGDVLLMEIVHHLGTVSLKMVYKFRIHQQLVCGTFI